MHYIPKLQTVIASSPEPNVVQRRRSNLLFIRNTRLPSRFIGTRNDRNNIFSGVAVFFILTLPLFITGCGGGSVGENTLDTSTAEAMLEYLRDRRIPAMEQARIWDSGYGKGLEIKTAHYVIRTTLLEPLMLNQLPGFVESAYRGYQSQIFEEIETTGRMEIYLFKNRQQWEEFTKEWAPDKSEMYLKIKSGAYCHNGACVAYNIGRESTFAVLGHEGWHQFNSRFFEYRLPSWLDEGVAMLFEQSRYDKGSFSFEPSRNLSRLGALKRTINNKNMMSVKRLVSINPGEVMVTDNSDDVMGFYAQAYALARFLREDDYGKRLGAYHQMLTDGLKGNWKLDKQSLEIAANRNIRRNVRWNRKVGRGLFETYISPDYEEIEQEYRRFCRKIVYHIRLKQ